jgi:cell division protein FtsA
VTDSDLIVALDLGTSKVLTLVGALEGERLQILGAGTAPSAGMVKGVIVDLEEAAGAVLDSVAAAERSAGAHIGAALVSINGDHLASFDRRGGVALGEPRQITEADVREARRAARQAEASPDRVILHHLPRGYRIDGQEGVRHPAGMTAAVLEAETHLVTAGASFLDNLLKCVARAGLDVEDVVAAPLASGLAVASDAEQALGVLVIDLGGGATGLTVFHDGSLAHCSALPVGGSHLTFDLSVGLRLKREEAERLKRASGCARVPDAEADEFVTLQRVGEEDPREVPRRLIPEILEPRVTEIAELIREQVSGALGESVLPLSAVVTGGGSLLRGLPAAFAEGLGIPARAGLARHVQGPDAVMESPAAATAVGLLKYGAARRGPGGLQPGWSGSLFQRLGRWLQSRRR